VVAKQSCFALKGGSAINLFIRDLPRLSIDIDLTYLPVDHNRSEAIEAIELGLTAISADLERQLACRVKTSRRDGGVSRLFVELDRARIKIEVSPVLRGCVHTPSIQAVTEPVEDEFGFAEIQVLDFNDLYAGKLCAALDRQHPRDLYDVKLLLEREGISNALKNTFLVYLLSHQRPIAELLAPKWQDIEQSFVVEFVGMTVQPVTVEELMQTRERLVTAVMGQLTDEDRSFLLSFKSGEPDWDAFWYPDTRKLPAIRWKLQNIARMPGAKHQAAIQRLGTVLR
jgi:predicted nucleotidyltransferase component of viral defense system